MRYVIVGKKTEQSLRRVPLPAAVLPFLPKSIKGPLFAKSTRTLRTRRRNVSIDFLMTVASRTRARSFIRCAIVRKIGCARPVAPKMYVGKF